ncbi:TlpA family protein disulfide reductase [Salibacter halophilus]|uniref:TlpA family protein disulfide reductase n=2 Tax=Salibacter halophilus TaxID=1803916 RepID=A0A6N6M6T4_9FLAO|nr:TlpA family protein disulfide reductase [Salibacter halophilus]
MKMMNRLLVAVFSLSLLTSCLDELGPTGDEKPFENTYNIAQDTAKLVNQNTDLYKIAVREGKRDTALIEKPDWSKELLPFIEAENFNTLGNKPKYQIDSAYLPLSKIKVYRYYSDKESAKIKEAVYEYQNGKLKRAHFEANKENIVYKFDQNLTYTAGRGYSITSSQNVKKVLDEAFSVRSVFMNDSKPFRLTFHLPDEKKLMVRASLKADSLVIFNNLERIAIPLTQNGDSTIAELPVFQSELHLKISDKRVDGYWLNLDKGSDYRIPVTGVLEMPEPYRKAEVDFSGKWELQIIEEDTTMPAIALFEQSGSQLYGTIRTEVGDYRYLSGSVTGDSFRLSTFDGSHAFYFEGALSGSDQYEGSFYSGIHYKSELKAIRNENAELRDPDELTKSTEKQMNFTFPNLAGEKVSLDDERYSGKAVVVNVMGTWCPNCMDETRYLKKLYEKYNDRGLEIISLAFERESSFEKAKPIVQKAVQDLGIPYEVLLTGYTPQNAEKAIPELDKIMSFPTMIILSRDHKIVHVHTGFNGPATGKAYDKFVKETEGVVEKALK